LPDWLAAYTVDPIRTRVFFLDLIPLARRRAFVRHAAAETLAAVKRQRLKVDEARGSAAEYLGRLGALRQLEARLSWLREVERILRTKPTAARNP
jgi:hypothetical protein